MAATLLLASTALAAPVVAPFGATADSSAVAAAALSGRWAVGDLTSDSVTIHNVDGGVARTITRGEIAALVPWMNLDASGDGPGAMAFSDSGRLLFIAVHDANAATDGQPSDAILRYDVLTDTLGVFARLDLSSTDAPTHGSMAHYKGRLYVGFLGGVRCYRAQMNDTIGTPLYFASLASGQNVTGLTIDRGTSTLYASASSAISRAPITTANSLTFTSVGTISNMRSLAYGEFFGGAANAGLYALSSDGASSSVQFITPSMARGTATFAPTTYTSASADWRDLVPAADGSMMLGRGSGAAQRISDNADTRLSHAAWTQNEFTQVVNFAKSLVTTGPGAGGGPAGWVIDADVQQGWTRFHPATPDAAAWTVLLLIASDEINNDASAQATARTILQRYAGQATDGIKPSRTVDGIYRHWIDPNTGGVKSGWDPEFATMSTMKIVLAASRARKHWPGDVAIKNAADAIICSITNWDSYFDFSGRMYLGGSASGGGLSPSQGFHEGILFAEQVGAYGGSAFSTNIWNFWKNRASWPSASNVTGRTTATNAANSFLPAFITMYANQLIGDVRSDAAWQTHLQNLRLSHAAWVDDNGPKWNTVFSAGTTRSDWGGYNADSLSNHPGDVATFTSLEAFASGTTTSPGWTPEAVGAYHAYRTGARQTFLGGASILYRRSNVDLTYQPNSAGLPDVAIGGLGLAELLSPGFTAASLAGAYVSCGACAADFNGDGFLDFTDFDAFVAAFEAGDGAADFNADGFLDFTDFDAFVGVFEVGC
ncbi:MAG: EF-hand domain-containing protein [Planctomycetota bacterium]|nr:EF-hand domain-containing protein [Planctomycetota bacterium]